MTWRGADLVKPLLGGCSPVAVLVRSGAVGDFSSFTWGFAKMADAPATLFTDADKVGASALLAGNSNCPVIGWAEHVVNARLDTDASLLKYLKLQATPDQVDIRRHPGGFVLLRREPLLGSSMGPK